LNSTLSFLESSIAVPASNGISLTKKRRQRVFGHNRNNFGTKLSTDVALAAQSSATVVVLMGMSKLNEIVAIFSKKRRETCCNYSKRNHSRVGMGTINPIEQVVFEQKIKFPAIIVIGEV
jgi:uroporphyrin-III C-methyltransferase